MKCENVTRYLISGVGELLPDFIVKDIVEGNSKHVACYIKIMSLIGRINFKINGNNDFIIIPGETIEFTLEKHGVINSISVEEESEMIIEVGYVKTSISNGLLHS